MRIEHNLITPVACDPQSHNCKALPTLNSTCTGTQARDEPRKDDRTQLQMADVAIERMVVDVASGQVMVKSHMGV